MAPTVPLATLYYLLCYAWNRLPEPADGAPGGPAPFHRPLELLTQLLLQATRRLLRTGLPLAFEEHEEVLGTLRGRVELGPSLARGLLPQGRAVCRFAELGPDAPLARLLAATLSALAARPALPVALRREVQHLRRLLPGAPVGAADAPSAALFGALHRLRWGGEAAFALHLCELLWRHALPAPGAPGRGRVRDFRRDEPLMARLFEQFVRNFYRREQRQYRVFAETIAWQAQAAAPADLDLLPTMLTDTTLESPARKIILDTKYYAAALRPRYDRPRLIAPHLYQLFAYLQNQAPAPGQALEGILLYPAAPAAAAPPLDARYTLGPHPVRVATLNLHQPWPGIAADLLALVA
ncbi:5-methylcytosine restriction system specificity protein McrC [Hymenobacter nivis]|uniref:5-methylcytosine-specific restriction endonuclease system specificity protein McrC n=1 Tax=Hymenobacter nivis TaxID=1850093 RepID=A0A502GM80_9BACT|nr:hypothetical protein [Hymenobacter nivis]TPG62905.1 hypothetical protein EAH73_17715 [Hymenobacter nivis]